MDKIRVDSPRLSDGELVIVDYDLITSCGEGVTAICKICNEWIPATTRSFNEFIGLVNNHTELHHG